MSDRDVRKLAKIVADHSRQIKGLSGGPQAAHTSIEGGSIDAYDNDGKMRLRIGAQDDGTHSVKYVQGPPPPRPTAPVVSVDGPVVRVRWDGMLVGGHIPEDFSRIDVHFALASDDLEDPAAVRGNLATSAGNETVLAATSTGTYRVGLVAMSQSRARSEMSDTVEVEVELVNLKGAIDTAVDNSRGGSNYYSPEPPSGTDHDPDRDLWFDTSVDAEGLVSYTPHRWDEAAQDWVSVGDQRTAAIQDAQDDLAAEVATVRTSVDGKNAITQSIDAPPSQYDGAVGDRWERMSSMGSGGSLISNWRWNGDVWVSTIISDAVLGNVDAAKIGTGYLDADRIEAGSITADKMLVGPRPDNLLVDVASVTGSTDPHQPADGSTLLIMPGITGVDGYNPGQHLMARAASDPGQNTNRAIVAFGVTSGGTRAPVEPSTDYALSALVRVGSRRPHGTPDVHWAYTEYDSAGASLGTTYLWDSQTTAAWDWSTVSGWFVTQRATSSVEILLRCNQPDTDVRIVKPAFRPMVTGTLIENGAITTDKIAVGAITAESGIIGSLDAGVITVGEMNGARIEAGTIDTPQLAFGAATGDVLSVDALNFKTAVGLDIRGSSFRAGDAVEITEDFGIRQFGPDGALNVSLPSDGSEAQFRGDLSARTLTATGRMSIQGPGAVASGGVLELESGVVPPVAGPQITNTWERITFPPLEDSEQPAGLVWAEGHWWRAVQVQAGQAARVEKIAPTGTLVSSFETAFGTAVNGVTYHDGLLYVLGAVVGGIVGNRWVVAYHPDGTESHRWEYLAYGTGTYQPGIGAMGANIVIAQCWASSGHLTWRIYRPTDGYRISQYDTDRRFMADVRGVYYGEADFGAHRFVFARSSQANEQFNVTTHSSEPTFESANHWHSAGFQTPIGIGWDGERFHALDPEGNLVAYESRKADRLVGDNDDDWWAAITWQHDGHQTTAGPPTRFTYYRRSRVRIDTGDHPHGAGGFYVYLAKTPQAPDRTDLHWVWRISDATEWFFEMTDIVDFWQTTDSPPTVNSFPADTPGEIRSGFGNFRVDGSGAGEWGPLDFHADGTMTGPGTAVTGSIAHGTVEPNSEEIIEVTFPAGRFTKPPTVILTNSNGRITAAVDRINLTATSFRSRAWNFTTQSSGTSTTWWAAFEEA